MKTLGRQMLCYLLLCFAVTTYAEETISINTDNTSLIYKVDKDKKLRQVYFGSFLDGKGAAVVFLLIIALGRVQRHRCHGADGLADLIVSKGKGRIVKLIAPAAEGLEGLTVKADHAAGSAVYRRHILAPALADHRQLAAGNDNALTVDHADGSIRVFLQLQNYVLKDSSGHGCSSSTRKLWITQGLPAHTYCAICQ